MSGPVDVTIMTSRPLDFEVDPPGTGGDGQMSRRGLIATLMGGGAVALATAMAGGGAIDVLTAPAAYAYDWHEYAIYIACVYSRRAGYANGHSDGHL